ncbi:hypothetical protein BO71DRAFT_365186 [Aspergillus ellipticus CBS 707.79]|uniref:Zn(2)-C6 fungal-type domain-containing protein n=1 Tax=Aspergillus ellipticus CBS 707.79 TaxID=1448320 RepID=A0A319CVC6_9EURO|nr:hypothetical protein BO71DRAFT_365186 [Aspergillus ellipticus CBS 707.79]
MCASIPSIPSVSLAESSRLNRSGRERKKQWAPKVKTGCITCRIRRVKCDEAKPSCLKCSSTGRKCDGYSPAPLEQPPDVLQMPSPWELFSGDEIEAQNFHFFCTVTTPDLAGFFDTGFWTGRLLQVAHQYPALRHATIALGSIHRDYVTDPTPVTVARSEDGQNLGFALQQSNAAIQALRELLAGPALTSLDRLVVLSICILFTCASSMQGHQWQAFMHINSGLKLLHHWNLGSGDRSPPAEDRDMAMVMLLITLTQLDTQARPYILSRLGSIQWADSPVVIISPVRPPFQSLLEAYIALEVHSNSVMQLTQSDKDPQTSPDAPARKQRLIADLQQWDDDLADYLARTPLQAADQPALNLLRIRRTFTRIPLSLDPSKGELAHDDLLPEYTAMLHLADQILAAQKQDRPAHPTYRLAPTVIEPLFLVAARCREPTLRHQALSLLQRYPRREGICEGMGAARIVERSIEIEEGCLSSAEGCCSVSGRWVCANHRVSRMQFFIVTERQLRIVMRTVGDVVDGREGSDLLVSWW